MLPLVWPAIARRAREEVADEYTDMMDERFVIFKFKVPVPMADRVKNWPQCGRCAAQFFAEGVGDTTTQSILGGEPAARPLSAELPIAQEAPAQVGTTSSDGTSLAPAASDGDLVAQLERLARLHSCGALDAEEFQVAKRTILKR